MSRDSEEGTQGHSDDQATTRFMSGSANPQPVDSIQPAACYTARKLEWVLHFSRVEKISKDDSS